MKFNQLYFTRSRLDYLKLKVIELNDFVQLRKTLILMKYQATHGHIVLHPTFNFIHGYYILYTHQGCLESHVRSASPTERFTATSLHPTRHLLFIFPLSQPHLLSFLILLLFWTNGKRSWLILCGRHLFLPISTLLLFIPFIITQSNPSLLHSLVSKQTLHTHFNPSLPNTLLHNSQGNCLRSLRIQPLCMRIHPS